VALDVNEHERLSKTKLRHKLKVNVGREGGMGGRMIKVAHI
jgi:hypothetical protein